MHSWLAVQDDLPDQAKLRTLAKLLGLRSKVEAVGYVVFLWIFTLKNAWRDGNLEPWGDDGIEDACSWRGEPGVLVQALRECGKEKNGAKGGGFLDGFVVHDWMERQRLLIRSRLWHESHRKKAPAGSAGKPPAKRQAAAPTRPVGYHRPSSEDYRARTEEILKQRGLR